MPRLIIGHTTANSSRIWLRGSSVASEARLTLIGPDSSKTYLHTLLEKDFYTGVVEVTELKPETRYQCEVDYLASKNSDTSAVHESGSFSTAPTESSEGELVFMFGSCNLHGTGIYMNPDRPYRRLVELTDRFKPAFMLHCGDQIYYDIPNIWKHPNVNEYRKKYLDAWEDCAPAKKLLANIPNYMILDDHEMVDNFSNETNGKNNLSSAEEIRRESLKAYEEFQHSHNPNSYGNGKYFYNFNWGSYQFFVLDGRTERWVSNDDDGSFMITGSQMQAFKSWLLEHKSAVKFVVCAVPFVAEVTVSDDKWSGAPFRKQREEIMAFLLQEGINNLLFITGDMHHSYYASMEIVRRADDQKIYVHELMSSPINNRVRTDINAQYDNGRWRSSENGKLGYISKIHARDTYARHPNITLVRVKDREVRYEIHRTRDGLTGWIEGPSPVKEGWIPV